jgi:Protein of unknown function (DUF3352)
MLGAVGERLRGLRYLIGDLLFAVARVPRAFVSGVAGFWRSLPVITRRRLVAALGAVAVVLLVATLIVPNLPCSLPGGDECAPDDDALDLAPAASVAYLHANLDPETDQAAQATELAGRMPLVSRQLIGQAATLLGAGAPLAAATEDWFGGEAAAIVLGSGSDDERVQLLETTDAAGARSYVESIAGGVPETSRYRDVEVTEDARGVASAVVNDFLVLGTSQGVRAVIDVATGAEGAESLAGDDVATEALDELPEHRVAEAYLSADGIEALVASRRGSLATFEPLVDSAASRGAALSLSAEDDGFELAVRSVLDPERADAEPGFFAAFEAFEPELPDELAADTLVYLGLGQPRGTVAALLRQATVRAPGIAAGFAELIENLRGEADVDLQGDLLGALGGEAAFTVVPRTPDDSESEALPPASAPTPYLEFLAKDVDEERAREALARLQGPIARSLDPELGAPVFEQRSFGDLDAEVLRLSPVAQIVYATFDSRLVIANDFAAVERLAEGVDDPLADADRYRDTVDELPDEPDLLAYLDLRGLLSFAEQSGLAEDTSYSRFAPDLRRLGSLGLAVTQSEDSLAVDARLLVD